MSDEAPVMKHRLLGEIEGDLRIANMNLETVAKAAREACRAETECRNAVNALQGELNAAFSSTRKNAPRDTDFHNEFHRHRFTGNADVGDGK